FRTWAGGRARGRAFLDDYAALVRGLIDLYEADFEPRWIDAALRFDAVLRDEFEDPGDGGFFYTGRHHEALLTRSRHAFDGATPAGNSLHAGNLLRLAALTGDPSLRARGERTLGAFAALLQRTPEGLPEMLCALDWSIGPTAEVAISGGGPEAEALAR